MEIVILVCVIGYFVYGHWQYKKTAYYQITKNSYFFTRHDRGRYGEYLTYKALRYFENEGGKFLFNIYLPKTNNETTEIDVLLICRKGVFVFESKNFSGWIFGNEAHKNWTQTLPRGRGYSSHKERFYNPIMQNAGHIRHLKRIIGDNIPIHSVIVFSDECTFKDVTIESPNVIVVNRYNVLSEVRRIYDDEQSGGLTVEQMDHIYNVLYPYTQLNGIFKDTHITNLQGNV